MKQKVLTARKVMILQYQGIVNGKTTGDAILVVKHTNLVKEGSIIVLDVFQRFVTNMEEQLTAISQVADFQEVACVCLV